MGLKNPIGPIVFAMLLVALSGCPALKNVTKRDVSPADRDARNQTWYFDCCNPALNEGTKELCKDAAVDEDHILHDTEGNKYVFIWSECEIGKERWRKWE